MHGEPKRPVTVFGGTGFLGRRVVRCLRDHGLAVRIASRHPDSSGFRTGDTQLQLVRADIRDDKSVADAVTGADAVVNAVSLYVEHGRDTFGAIHVDCARRAADQARRAGVEKFVHISGIGAEVTSTSPYIRSRGEGELAVRGAFPGAVIVRPAVMFAPDNSFLTLILKLLRRFPVYLMFGQGRTRMQPAHADDVAEAIALVVSGAGVQATTFEFAGPRVYTYEALLRSLAQQAGLNRTLVPVPFVFWRGLAQVAKILPNPPITRNQVELMQADNVASPELPGFKDLGIEPQSVEAVARAIIRAT